jgi:RHS repeat-associated protein
LIRSTGPQAKANPFRFSTKYTDEESDLVYYGYRYYSPSLGRWINRDPIEEEDDLNLYGFCRNDGLNARDKDGRLAVPLVVAYLVCELAMAAIDTYVLFDTLADPDATFGEKILTAAGFALSAVGPGGAYTLLGKRAGGELVSSVSAQSVKCGFNAVRRVGDRLETVYDVLRNPSLLTGKGPAEIKAILGKTPGWRVETLGKGTHEGQGWILREYAPNGKPTGRMIRWHLGGGHHGPDPYWRVTGGVDGKSGIIPGGPEP